MQLVNDTMVCRRPILTNSRIMSQIYVLQEGGIIRGRTRIQVSLVA